VIPDELSEEIILDHHRRPRNFRALDPCHGVAQGVNPSCGDEVKVYVHRKDGMLDDVSFTGQGCAISRASASLMTLRCKGQSENEVRDLTQRVRAMLVASGPEVDGDLIALAGVRNFPARVKCALLPWHALEAALDGRSEATSE
jgi:nitrogen fixation NifU-like protein